MNGKGMKRKLFGQSFVLKISFQHFLPDAEFFDSDSVQGFSQRFACYDACLFFQFLTVFGQMDEVGAPVSFVGDAYYQMLPFHIVYQAGHAGLVLEGCIA